MKCENCKYWQDYEDTPDNIKVGSCSKVKMFWNCTEWVRVNEDTVETRLSPDCETLAFVRAGRQRLPCLFIDAT